MQKQFGQSTLRTLVHTRVGNKIPVVFGGKQSKTDGNTIFVADLPDSSNDLVRLTAEVHSYHEAEHVKVLNEMKADPSTGVNRLADMLDMASGHHPQHLRGLVLLVNNVLEDLRIDRRANLAYPGTIRKYRESERYIDSLMDDTKLRSVDKVRRLLMMLLLRCRNRFYVENMADPVNFLELPEDQATYAQLLGPLEEQAYKLDTYDQVVKLGDVIVERIVKSTEPPPPPPQNDEPQEDESQDGDSQEDEPQEDEPQDGDSPDGDPQEDEPQDGDPQEDEPQDGEPQDGDSQDGDSQDGDSQDGDSQDGDSQDGEPQDGDSQDGEPQDGDSQDGDSQDGEPQDGDSQDGEPQDGDSQDGDSQDGEPQDGEPQDGDSQDGDSQDGEPQDGEPIEGLLEPRDIIQTDISPLDQGIIDAINAEARNYYSTHPDVKDSEEDFSKACNSDTDWAKAGSLYFAGHEAKLRQLMMADRAPKKVGGLRRGRKLDTHNLHKMRDIKLGKQPGVWARTLQGKNMHTALMISMDESGSMNGDPWLTSVKVVAALTRILDTVRVKYAVTGWTTGSRVWYGSSGEQRTKETVHTWYHKWEGRLNQKAFPYNPRGRYTPSASGLEKALQELNKRNEERKILFFFTDGSPSTDRVSTVVELEHMRELVDRSSACGVSCVGFGINISPDSSASINMSKVFGDNWIPIANFESGDIRSHATIMMSKLKEAIQ